MPPLYRKPTRGSPRKIRMPPEPVPPEAEIVAKPGTLDSTRAIPLQSKVPSLPRALSVQLFEKLAARPDVMELMMNPKVQEVHELLAVASCC